jgi:signal transduction histidine kinase
MRSRIAWLLFALTVPCALGQTVLLGSMRPLLSAGSVLEGWPIVTGSTVVGALVGALVVSRYPGHVIGWLLIVGQFATAFGLFAAALGSRANTLDPVRPADLGHAAAWVGALLAGNVGLALLAAMFLLAPDGRLLSRRWRVAAVTCWSGLAVHVAAVMTVSPLALGPNGQPLQSRPLTRSLASLSALLVLAALIAGATSLVLRLRDAEGETRRKVLWVAAPGAALALGLVVLLVAQLPWRLNRDLPPAAESYQLVMSMPLFVAWAALPVCAGIAVLRHRLFDIDVVVNRALVLTVTTAFVAVAYVCAVVALGALPGRSTEPLSQSLVATAVAALAFQPLRRRVVRLADRLAYGPRAVPYEALADLSARLSRSPTPDQLLAAAAAAAGAAVSATGATAGLDLRRGEPLTAVWQAAPARTHRPTTTSAFEVSDQGEVLGRISVHLPAGRSLRPPEHRLLTDLAEQAGVAFRNARLEAELVAHVAVLDQQTAELARSRRRIVEARDEECARLERAISQDVVPHLAPIPDELAAAAKALATGTGPLDLSPIMTRVTEALEALRRLGHGVFPTQLSRSGLGPALRSLLARTHLAAPLELSDDVADRRFPAAVEAAIYFCCDQVAREATEPFTVSLSSAPGQVVLTVRPHPPLPGLRAAADRIEAVGGTLGSVPTGSGDALEARMPVPA